MEDEKTTIEIIKAYVEAHTSGHVVEVRNDDIDCVYVCETCEASKICKELATAEDGKIYYRTYKNNIKPYLADISNAIKASTQFKAETKHLVMSRCMRLE